MMNLTIIVLIVCPSLCIVMFIYYRWYIKRRTSETGILKETRIEAKNIISHANLSIAEINDATERNLLLIEDKINQLKQIIEDADKRISVYVKELEKSKTSEALYTQLGRGVRAAIKEPAPQLQLVQSDSLKADDKPPKKEAEEPQRPPSKKQIRIFIDQLANEGLTEQEIASRLNISIAEVDLAMQLRRK